MTSTNRYVVAFNENDCGALQPLPMSRAKVCAQAYLPNHHLDALRRAYQRRSASLKTWPSAFDGDGGSAGPTAAAAAAVGLGFDVGPSGVAGEMMGSIYRSLGAL
jgi:hypothetical protein